MEEVVDIKKIADFFHIEQSDVKLLMSNVDWSDVGNEMDKECIPLCEALNGVRGIVTSESCSGHGKYGMSIYFHATSWKGLFFVTRCIDRRYWQYGHKWTCELCVGDRYEDGLLPTHFYLHSEDVGEEAYKQANDLVQNMNLHLNHKNFKKGYDLTDEDFIYEDKEFMYI